MEEIQQIEQKESIECNLTAKGLWQFTVKVRDLVLTDDTIVRLKNITDKLIIQYPNNVISGNKTE
jgi:hypothetical protein